MAAGDKKIVSMKVNGQTPDGHGNVTVEASQILTAGGESVETALSNKAEKSTHMLSTYTSLSQIGISVGAETMAAIAQAMPDNSTLTISAGAANNAVADGTAYPVVNGVSQHYGALMVNRLDVNRVTFSFFASTAAMGMYVATYNHSQYGWSGWNPVAPATQPQEYDLPLASGIVNNSPAKSVYFKNQFGVVTVSIHAHGENDVSNGTVISTLPEGYRPQYGLAVYSQGAFISFDANGNVVLYGDGGQSLPSGNWIAANVSFLAQ